MTHLLAPRTRQRPRRRGYLSVSIPIFAFALMAILGMLYDGGRALVGSRTLDDLAQSVARAGAQEVDVFRLRSEGVVVLDPARVAQVVTNFVDSPLTPGYDATLYGAHVELTDLEIINDREVRVRLEVTYPQQILQLYGMPTRTVSAVGVANAEAGVSESGDL